MQYITNGKFAILLIPECKQASLREVGFANKLDTRCGYDPDLGYIIPYRKPYDRIIRGIGADLHEIMLDRGVLDLNKTKWGEVREQCLDYIINWVELEGHLPIKKNFCHTGHITAYFDRRLNGTAKIFDVDSISDMIEFISNNYQVDLGTVPELPKQFYENTVPYWEIDALYNSHKKMRTLIDEWCACDLEKSSTMIVDNLFINT